MEKLKKAESLLLDAQSVLLAAILFFLVAMSFLQVVLRQFFGGGILWCDTLLRHLVLWVGFLGAARASAEEKHFAFEALSERLPRRPRRIAAQLARAAAVAVSLLLARASWAFMIEKKLRQEALFHTAGWTMPAWPLAAILPAGFLLVALHTLLRLWLDRVAEEGGRP